MTRDDEDDHSNPDAHAVALTSSDAAAAHDDSGEEGSEERGEDEHERDQSDGLVQVRDVLLLLHAYSSHHPPASSSSDARAVVADHPSSKHRKRRMAAPPPPGARPVDIRIRTLCVGPLNTQWLPEEDVSAAAEATNQIAASALAPSASAVAPAAAANLSYPRPYLTSLFLRLDGGCNHGGSPLPLLDGHFPLRREDRGPDMYLRMLRAFIGPDHLSHVYEEAVAAPVPTQAMDDAHAQAVTDGRSTSALISAAATFALPPALDRFVIRAFPHSPVNPAVLRSLLSLPDAEFLAQSSTSPLVEPPSFLPDMRDCYTQLMRKHTHKLNFPKGSKQKNVWQRKAAPPSSGTGVASTASTVASAQPSQQPPAVPSAQSAAISENHNRWTLVSISC